MRKLMTGNEAAALAAKLAQPHVVAAYPITPQTSIAEKLATYTANGELKAQYIKVESETSALAACIGGSLSGARVFTATSSQGLALMHELLHWASGARLPIVLVNVNRSMAAPWSLGVDHNDTLSQRDTGCLQLYCETAQEVLDSVLIGYKLAEEALLPILVCMDGFLLSHYSEPVEVPDAEKVRRFLPRRKALENVLDPRDPCTLGGGVSSEALYQMRQQMQVDMENVLIAFERICKSFQRRFGRCYQAVESVIPQKCDVAIVCNGTLAGTVKAYLKQGGLSKGAGMVKMRLFRPFPYQEVRKALSGFKRAVIIDRNLSPGSGGVFAQEIKSALYGTEVALPIISVIGGLAGVDVTPDQIDRVVRQTHSAVDDTDGIKWMEA
jgi:pyruvate/2-oxoacid:ferredoxin oxidoreductase alpha subunit